MTECIAPDGTSLSLRDTLQIAAINYSCSQTGLVAFDSKYLRPDVQNAGYTLLSQNTLVLAVFMLLGLDAIDLETTSKVSYIALFPLSFLAQHLYGTVFLCSQQVASMKRYV